MREHWPTGVLERIRASEDARTWLRRVDMFNRLHGLRPLNESFRRVVIIKARKGGQRWVEAMIDAALALAQRRPAAPYWDDVQ